MLKESDIKEFKELYRNRYGTELSDVDARRHAENLLQFYRVLFKGRREIDKAGEELGK